MARRIGGVWKVAYADFVTALMALFIVLWLIRSGREVRAAVAGYFRDPLGYQRLSGSAKAGSGETMAATTSNVEELKKHLEEAMRQLPDAQKLPLRRVHGHRRRSANRAHGDTGRFVFGDRQFPPNDEPARSFSRCWPLQISHLPNPIAIEGHTDSRSFHDRALEADGNWEPFLRPGERARRIMLSAGLRGDQVTEVRVVMPIER